MGGIVNRYPNECVIQCHVSESVREEEQNWGQGVAGMGVTQGGPFRVG